MARPTQVKKEVIQKVTMFSKKVAGNQILIKLTEKFEANYYEIIDCSDEDVYNDEFNFSYQEGLSIDFQLAKLECLKACLEHIKTLQND